jgi:hypothetical protein
VRDGLEAMTPSTLADPRVLVEVVALAEHVDQRVLAVLRRAPLLDLAVGDHVQPVGVAAGLGDDITGLEHQLAEGLAELRQQPGVGVGEQRQLAQILGEDPGVIAVELGADQLVADGEAAVAIDAVRPRFDLHPGQRPQQIARGDRLHLRDGLGGRRQRAGRCGAEAALRLFSHGGAPLRRDGNGAGRASTFPTSRPSPEAQRRHGIRVMVKKLG